MCKKRIAAGFSQDELAQKLGMPQSFVSKIERGERQMRVLEFVAVCKILELDSSEMLTEFLNADEDSLAVESKSTRVRRQFKS
ncbi:MAG: helix-turn-helix transcriptional regulator [Armatimonadota bacterium]